jgi:hypothetical protein
LFNLPITYWNEKKNGGFEWKIKETIILKIINRYVIKSVQGSTHPFQ